MTFSFFFNDTATTEIYTLSLHDALPISMVIPAGNEGPSHLHTDVEEVFFLIRGDRKSTRLNSSHTVISYAVFCLKKKKSYVHRRQLPRIEAYHLRYQFCQVTTLTQ